MALNASGEYVGLVPDQMGNSEVGHNTMGAGQVMLHGIRRIDEEFKEGRIFETKAWREAIEKVLDGDNLDKNDDVWYNEGIGPATLHFAGIFSDGGVHSDISHLERMITMAYKEGVRKMRVHPVFDGRDVPPQSALVYIERFEEFIKKFEDADICLADGGGRMVYVADRYENDWQMGLIFRNLKNLVAYLGFMQRAILAE